MKKLFALAALAFASLSFSHVASAAGLDNYKSTNGITFSIDDVRKITYDGVNGKIVLTFTNGQSSASYLADNGSVFNKIKLDHPEFLTQGSNVMFISKYARWVTCDSNGTNMGWRNSGSESLGDSCTVYQQSQTAGKVGNP